jgi:hypothetical protein
MLLTAAAMTAGFLTAYAQAVYSINVVGYVNVPVPANPTFVMVANPLQFVNPNSGLTNNLNDLFTNAPNNFIVWEYTGSGWVKYTRHTSTGLFSGYDGHAINPGEGFMVQAPTGSPGITNTFTGNVLQGPTSQVYPAGISPAAVINPVAGRVMTDLGYPGANNDKIYTYDPTLGWLTATRHSAGAGSWSGSYYQLGVGDGSGEPTLSVGQGFFINSPAGGTWTRNFTVAP